MQDSEGPKRRPSLKFTSPLLISANEPVAPRVVKSARPRPRTSLEPPPPSTPTPRASQPPREARVLCGANAKGINFTTVLAAVEKIYGAAVVERVRNNALGDVGNALRYGGLVVGGWYPMEWYQELWASLAKELELDESAARAIGECAAGIGVNLVYRMFSRLASPAVLMRVSGSAFSSYFDTGSIRVQASGDKRLIAEWRGCTGFNPMLWFDSLGGAAYFLRATGVSDVRVDVLGGGGDEDWMLAEGRWR